MALEADVKTALINAGNTLKANLWTLDDLILLEARARDLVALNDEAAAETDDGKRAQHKLAAKSVVQQVGLLALLRAQVEEKEKQKLLHDFLLNVVIPAVGALLKALF